MSNERIVELYRRYGPLIFSRYHRTLRDVEQAAEYTHRAFVYMVREVKLGDLDDLQVIRYLHRLAR